MAIEVEERRLLKNELGKALDEMFISTDEHSGDHFDFSHTDGLLFVGEKEKKIPFFKFREEKDRKQLRKDFSEFFASSHVDEDADGNKFILSTVFLGMSSGKSRSYFVNDYKELQPLIQRYTKEHKTMALVVSHFSEKTNSNGSEVEHIHILYKNSVKDKFPFLGTFLEESYDE